MQKIIPLRKFIKDQLIVCSVYLLLYIMQKKCYIILRIV